MGKCGCGSNHCNNKCKPVCDPCSKQPKILYCGRPVSCLDIKRGDKIDDILKVVGDKLCQLQEDMSQVTYVNIEDATLEQCEYGGYVIQVLDLGSDNLIEQAIICNATPLTFQENGVEVSQALTVNFEDTETISVTAEHDVPSDTTTYSFDLVTTTNITWQEGIDLMDDALVIPNMLYYVTDRGWYLEGVDDENLAIEGYKIERVVKKDYYNSTGSVNIKGVWNLDITSLSIGDTVVWGGKVWTNVTGNLGAPTDLLFNLNADWAVSNNNIYYEDKLLKIHVDYRNDWVFRQEDDKNNVISIPQSEYGSFGLNNVWVDWNMPNLYNNHTSIILNNAEDKSLAIFNNSGPGKIVNNYSKVISGNITKTLFGIVFNKIQTIRNNIVNDVSSNECIIFSDNILDSTCSLNIIDNNIVGNICRGIISDNELPFIEENIMEDTFQNNSKAESFTTAGVKNSRFVGDVSNNTFSFLGIANSLITDAMFGNTGIEILKSELGSVVNNNSTRISNSTIIGASFNVSSNITNIITNNLTSNENCTISYTESEDITSNENCTITYNKVTGAISDNVHLASCQIQYNFLHSISDNLEVDEIEGNFLYGSVSNNLRIDKISFNQINGDIKENISSSNPSTGIEIIQNTSNGSIFYNTIDDNVVISNNDNNGNIGTDSVPTVRAVSIIGTVVNL